MQRITVPSFEELATAAFRLNPNPLVLSYLNDGKIIDVNDSFLKLFKRKREEVIGQTSVSLDMFADAKERGKLVEILRHDGRVNNYEIRILNALREEKTVLISTELINNQPFETMLTILQDISARKKIEDEAKENKERYEQLVEAANSIILRWKTNGEITFVNRYGLDFFGYDASEMLGCSVTILVPDMELETGRDLSNLVHNIVSEPEKFALFENENIRKNGERVWVSWTNRAITDANGRVTEILAIGNDITELKQKENKLRKNELRLRGMFNNAAIGIVEVDTHGRFLAVNDRLCNILGYTEEELLTKTIADLTWHEDQELSNQMNSRLVKGEFDIFDYEKRYIKKNGEPLWVHVTVSAIRDSHGKHMNSIGTVEDISARKKFENELKESEDRFHTLADNISQMAWIVDKSGIPVWFNKRWYEYTGVSFEEMKSEGGKRIVPPDYQFIFQSFDQAVKNGDSWENIYPMISKEGEHRWFLTRALPILDHKGQISQWFGTSTDIHEQKEAEEKVRTYATEIEAILSCIPDGVLVYDSNGHIIRSNEAADKILKYPYSEQKFTISERIRKHYRVIAEDGKELQPEEMPAYRAAIKGEVIMNEVLLMEGMGQSRWMNFSAGPLIIGGKHNGGVLSMLDITDLKAMEGHLKQRNEELTRFIYTVSHDLKSPLVTIKMFTAYLREDIEANDRMAQDRDLAYIEHAADKMGNLLNELLELSRIGRKEEPQTDVLLEKLIITVKDLLAGRIREINAKIIFDAPQVIIHGYQQRLIQLYQNLIDNALKFMGDQNNPIIEIGAEIKENDEIVLYIKDNGTGIDPRYQQKIFGLFEKLDKSSEGTGIGLALVKRIVEVHGGRIWLVSEPGKGSTFYFTLEKTRLLKTEYNI